MAARWSQLALPDPAPDVYGGVAPAGVVAIHGTYVAVGTVGAACCADGDPALSWAVSWTSADGRTWRVHDHIATFEHASLVGLVTDGARLVAFGTFAAPVAGGMGRSVPAVWVSDDGVAWDRGEDPAPSVVAGGPIGFVGAITTGDGAGSGTVVFATSADGRRWQPVSRSFVGIALGLGLGPTGAMAVGTLPSEPLGQGSLAVQMVAWSSSDRHTWPEAVGIADHALPVDVVPARSRFVTIVRVTTAIAGGDSAESTVVWLLGGATTVRSRIVLGTNEQLRRVFAVGDAIVAAGYNPDANGFTRLGLRTSTDGGMTFLPVDDHGVVGAAGNEITGMAAMPDGILAVGTQTLGFATHAAPVAWIAGP